MKMLKEHIIFEYQQFLLGNRNDLSYVLIDDLTIIESEKNAKVILKYVVEDLLGWKPEIMQLKFDASVVDTFKLESVLPHILLPEFIREDDYMMYSHALYPKKLPMTDEQITIRVYNWALNQQKVRLTGFFDGEEGKERAKICLSYAIRSTSEFRTIENVYDFFVSKKIAGWLRQQRLAKVCFAFWDSPLDFLHDTLPQSEDSDSLFQKYIEQN